MKSISNLLLIMIPIQLSNVSVDHSGKKTSRLHSFFLNDLAENNQAFFYLGFAMINTLYMGHFVIGIGNN